MNILIIFPSGNALYPHSGTETRIWNIISLLTENGFNISIIHSLDSLRLEDENLKKLCNIYYHKNFKLFGFADKYLIDFNPFFIFRLLRIIRKEKLDIIQVIYPWGLIITRFLKNKNTRLIYDAQGVEREFIKISTRNPKFPKFLTSLAIFFAKIYEKTVCRLADAIINVSEEDRNYMIKHYKINRKKTYLIQTISSLRLKNIRRNNELKLESRNKLNLPLNKTIVVFHGGLPHPPNREAFNLIKNYISVKLKNENILFVLAGYNLKKFKMQNLISLGFVENLKDFLYAADFAIVPIISGSGMRVKCTDYILTSLPFISTKKGIEGINFLEVGVDYLECRTVNAKFLKAIQLLSKDINLRNNIQEKLYRKSNQIEFGKFEKKFLMLYHVLTNF